MTYLTPGTTFTDYTPTTGSTVAVIVPVPGAVHVVVLSPAAALLTLAISLPTSPRDGQRLEIVTSQAVTTLSFTGGTLLGAVASLVAGSPVAYGYRASNSTWYRVS